MTGNNEIIYITISAGTYTLSNHKKGLQLMDNLKPNAWFCDNSLGFVNLGFKVGSSLEVNLDCFENLSEKSLFSKDHNNISLYTTIMYQYKEFSIQSRVSKWRLKCWRLKQFLFNYSLK